MRPCCHCGRLCELRFTCKDCQNAPLCRACAREAGLLGLEQAVQHWKRKGRDPERVWKQDMR